MQNLNINEAAPISPEATGEGQPFSKEFTTNISENTQDCNSENDSDLRDAQLLLRKISSPDYMHTVSLTELYDTVYLPKKQIIEGLLCSGAYLFAGAPKVGKSFFMAQLGYHISNGITLWDNYTVNQGVVLYLALEDDYGRLQKRLSRMFGTECTENFHFATHAKFLGGGLDSQLERFVRDHPRTRLIIIDTLQKVREAGGERFSYGNDYDIVTQFKRFADKHNICVLLVHHTRKQSADDCFETISGTNGLLGAADGAFILHKEKRTDDIAILDVVGRDQQDQRLHLRFDREQCIWEFSSQETEIWKEPPDPVLDAVAKLITPNSPIWSGSASELICTLDDLQIKPNVLTRRLNVGADRLFSEHGIRYENSRNHAGRFIKLTLDESPA